jgi:alginate O-acetyltransferase complex protein AlgI
MLFCSQAFLLFFAAVFTAYWLLPWHRGRVWLLLVASFYFYASWNKWLACLIALSTTADYFLARGMDHFRSPRLRKLLVLTSIGGNLGLLCYFKYANFFLRSVEGALHAWGAHVSLPVLSVLLPVGISFYTFEAISYTVDVYRRRIPAERNLASFLLFITFFPHLVAGPIVRARDFLPQVRRRKRWDWARLQLGAEYFLMGLFKKLAIADRMAAFVDPVFAHPDNFRSSAVWLAMFAYALQVYGDFSGYTDMAIGAAHMLGYRLTQNFNMPYLAANIADFWRRWHMSLSNWLRDYLFFPLGGSRAGFWKVVRNLLITMVLCGLWHGARWTYVLFGAWHGLLLIINRQWRHWAKVRPRLQGLLTSFVGTATCVTLTFLTFCFTLLLFRAVSLADFGTLMHRLVVPTAGDPAPVRGSALLLTYAVVGLCHWIGCQVWFKHLTVRLPGPIVGLGYTTILLLALVLAPQSGQAFIYFQF